MAEPYATVAKSRKSGLTTLELHVLDVACRPVWKAFGHTYLVGTAQMGGPYRDVDVRTILPDEDFDRLFGEGGEAAWSLVCLSVGLMLAQQTGLPIDYQIQRMTEANATYPGGNRNPLGMGSRVYAGGGDATRFSGAVLPLPRPITESEKQGVLDFLNSLATVDNDPSRTLPAEHSRLSATSTNPNYLPGDTRG
jgi:hypothetical protein